MKKELAQTEHNAAQLPIQEVEAFTERLHDAPLSTEILTNAQANGAQYIPVGIIEAKLDKLFFGLWQIKNFRWQVVANEIVGSLELHVYHPVLREWIVREGAGAVLIQQSKGSEIGDINAKIKNTLVKDFPHLKSECLKNAAKSLGAFFGRALNRVTDDYAPYSEQIEAGTNEDFRNQLDNINGVKELVEFWKANPQYHQNPVAIDAFLNRKKELLHATTRNGIK